MSKRYNPYEPNTQQHKDWEKEREREEKKRLKDEAEAREKVLATQREHQKKMEEDARNRLKNSGNKASGSSGCMVILIIACLTMLAVIHWLF